MLKGKSILITGGSGRIGDTLVDMIERQGGKALFTTRDAAKAESFNRRADEKGMKSVALVFAMRDEDETTAFVRTLVDTYGVIDGFVHNAYAALPFKPVGSIPWRHWDESIRIGVAVAETVASALVEDRARSGIKSIVNIASIYGIRAPQFGMYGSDREPNPVYYGAVKAGVLALTRYLAAYWGPLGIRVNAVTPGGIEAGQDSDFLANYGETVPQGRMVTAHEVSSTILFLLGDESSGVTGANVIVDAGKTIW